MNIEDLFSQKEVFFTSILYKKTTFRSKSYFFISVNRAELAFENLFSNLYMEGMRNILTSLIHAALSKLRKGGSNIFLITKKEAEFIRKKKDDICIVKTCKLKNKGKRRGKYYVEDTPKVKAILRQYDCNGSKNSK